MKQVIKENWIKALRSGEYEQAREVMRNDHGYCCLGVLCAISGFEPNGESFIDPAGREMESEFHEPQLDYFGLSREHQNVLIKLNDDDKRDFSYIADYIEQTIPTI